MKVFKKKPVAGRMTRLDALAYKPVKSQQTTETRLETGEVVLEYPLTVRPLISAVAKRL